MSSSHFDEIADRYDESLPAHVVEHYLSKRTRFVLEYCPPGRGLDVGCGTGVLAARLAGAGFAMTGLDPSQGMLDVMQERVPCVDAVCASGTSMPFADNEFDLVLTVAALHHVADPREVRATLSEIVRVAKPGGRIVIWDHNPRNPYWASLMARVPQDTGDERLIGEAELLTGLRAGGAQIIASTQRGLVPDFVPAAALGLAQWVERAVERRAPLRRYAAHNVVLATKPRATAA